MTKLFAAERVRARLRHVVVCRNGKGQPKEKIAQNKRARAGSFAIVYQCVKLSFSGVTFVWVCFVFTFFDFIEAVGPFIRSSRYMCLDSHTQSSNNYLCPLIVCVCVFSSLEMSLFPIIFCIVIAVFSLYGKYVVRFPFRLVFFHLVTTSWILTSAYVIIQSINQSLSTAI